jgi:superfamily II RNA helicase
VLTELLYDGLIKDATAQQIAALLSAFGCDEALNGTPEIPPDLVDLWGDVNRIVRRIVDVSKECGVSRNWEEYMSSKNPAYMMVTYNWAGGEDFSRLMELNPDLMEGSVIRTIKRTEEIARQAARAAREMGDSGLEVTILESITLMKRDIIFAASLYL